MATTTTEAKPAAPTWKGQVETRTKLIPSGKDFTKNGKPKLQPVRVTKIALTRASDVITFNVTHRNGQTSITDHRETQTGFHGTTGAFGTREPAKAGKPKSYTPSGWATEVERYVGWAGAIVLLSEAGCDF